MSDQVSGYHGLAKLTHKINHHRGQPWSLAMTGGQDFSVHTPSGHPFLLSFHPQCFSALSFLFFYSFWTPSRVPCVSRLVCDPISLPIYFLWPSRLMKYLQLSYYVRMPHVFGAQGMRYSKNCGEWGGSGVTRWWNRPWYCRMWIVISPPWPQAFPPPFQTVHSRLLVCVSVGKDQRIPKFSLSSQAPYVLINNGHLEIVLSFYFALFWKSRHFWVDRRWEWYLV